MRFALIIGKRRGRRLPDCVRIRWPLIRANGKKIVSKKLQHLRELLKSALLLFFYPMENPVLPVAGHFVFVSLLECFPSFCLFFLLHLPFFARPQGDKVND